MTGSGGCRDAGGIGEIESGDGEGFIFAFESEDTRRFGFGCFDGTPERRFDFLARRGGLGERR